MDDERLIDEVFKYNFIYDKSHPKHSSKENVTKAWTDISKEMNCSAGKRTSSGFFSHRSSMKGPMDLTSEEESLFVAISFGKVHRIASLIDKIDDINVRAVDQMTPLLHTCNVTRGELCSHVTRLLIKQSSCDINAQELSGRTALMYACMNKENTDAVRILVRHRDCDVNIADTEGFTALMHAVCHENTEAVRVLLLYSKSRHKLDVNVHNLEGNTATDLATRTKNKNICRLLVEDAGADITSVQQPGRLKSALHKT